MRIIGVEGINPNMKLGMPVYDGQGRLLLNKGVVLNRHYINRLVSLGISEIYVEDQISTGIEIPTVLSEEEKAKEKKVIQKVIADIKNSKGFYLRGIEEMSERILVAVANAFDILTNTYYFKKRFPVYQAVEYLVANSGKIFDKKVVDVLIKRLALYPNGTLVKLSTGEKAIVSDQNFGFPTRPVVLVISNEKGESCKNTRIEDLLTNHSMVIVESGYS